jgi:hypothetical protein
MASCSQLSGDPLIFDTYASKQIEQKKDNRSGWTFLPLLKQLEPRNSFLIQCHDLAIEDR